MRETCKLPCLLCFASTGQVVTNLGKTFSVPCKSDGSVTLPTPAPTCKVPVSCPTPPTPPTSSKLNASASSNVAEYDSAIYTCINGYTLANVTASGVANNQFSLTCGTGGTFPTSPTWPTCQLQYCVTVPAVTGFTTTSLAPVFTGTAVQYTCATAGQVHLLFFLSQVPRSPWVWGRKDKIFGKITPLLFTSYVHCT